MVTRLVVDVAGIRGADLLDAVRTAGRTAGGPVTGRRTDPGVRRGGPDRDGAHGERRGESEVDQLLHECSSCGKGGPDIEPLLSRCRRDGVEGQSCERSSRRLASYSSWEMRPSSRSALSWRIRSAPEGAAGAAAGRRPAARYCSAAARMVFRNW